MVAEEEEVRVRERGEGHARPKGDHTRREGEERGRPRNPAAPPYAVMEHPKKDAKEEEVGVVAEEEEVRGEGEARARPKGD